jgi:hypothetical protein
LIVVVATLAAAIAWRELNVTQSPAPQTQGLRGIGPDVDPLAFIDGEDVRIDRDIMDEFDRDRRQRRLRDDRPLSRRSVAEAEAAFRQRQTDETAEALIRSLGYLSYAESRVHDYRAALATMQRMTALCARHRHNGRIHDECDSYSFYEHRGDVHLALGDAVAARADYARTEYMMRQAKAKSDGCCVGTLDPDWDFWVKFTIAAAQSGNAQEAIRVANQAVDNVKPMAAEHPAADTLQRRYAWSLNWRGDAHRQARDKAAAERDYVAALDVLRKYDVRLGTFNELADELHNGPPEFREYHAKIKASPAAADTLKQPDIRLGMRAPRRYVGKTKVQRDIGWTMRRLAEVRPAQPLDAEIAAIDAELRRRDPGPPSSDEYPAYMAFLHGDARRGANDLTGALEAYDSGLAFLREENSRGNDYAREQAREQNARPEAQTIARKGLVLVELGHRNEGRRLLDDAIAGFQKLHNETPWARDLAIDIAWAKELRATVR